MIDITGSNDPDRSLGEEWEALALRIHNCRLAGGRGWAVFGADHCQLCGALTSFATVAEARAVHLGADGERVCAACLRRAGTEGALAALAASPRRFCECCGALCERVPERRFGETWTCAPCASRLAAVRPPPRAAILLLLRRRYMAINFPSVAELQRLHDSVLALKARSEAPDVESPVLDG